MIPHKVSLRIIRRLALGTLPLLVGCTVSMTLQPNNQAAAKAPAAPPEKPKTFAANAPAYLPESMFAEADAPKPEKAPVVNVFGEFSRSSVRPAVAAADLGLRQHTFNDAGYDADVTLDPTGQWMAFTRGREGGFTQIMLQRQGGASASPRELTNSLADDAQPCFSPDGKRIAFCSNRTGSWHVFLMNTDGANVTQITHGECNDMHPSFSPDGNRLVYASLPADAAGAGAQWELRLVDLATRAQTQIGDGLFPAWSPDRSRNVIAFQKTRARGSRWFSLWTCELNGDQASNVTEIAVSSNAALLSPSWSPDGKNLTFASIVEPAQTRGGKPNGQHDVWVMAADGGDRRRLTDGAATNLTPLWSVDNRVYFISDRSGHDCVWSLPAGKNGAGDSGNLAGDPTRDMTKKIAPGSTADSAAAANDTAEIKP